MVIYKNLLVIGTSHIAKQSIKEIEDGYKTFKPEIIAIELDKKRLYGLVNKVESKLSFSDIKSIGIKGFLFAKIGQYVQKKLGASVGLNPGSDMLKAYEVAKENNCELALIDQNIEKTLKRFSEGFTWKEKFSIVWQMIKSPFSKDKEKYMFDLKKVPDEEMIEKMMGMVKEKFPSIYRVLIEERNIIMAKRLYFLMKDKRVMAVIGAGHEVGILEEIKRLDNLNIEGKLERF